MSRRISGSSALNGSSNSMISGSVASARARPTRCCIPPDSSSGYAVAPAPQPDRAEHLVAVRASRSSFSTPCTSRPNATFSTIRRCGSSPKCWNTMLTLRATDLAQALFVELQARPRRRSAPRRRSGSMQPVDASGPGSTCPLPDSPITTKTSPGRHVEGDVADGRDAPGLLEQLGPRQRGLGRPHDRVGLRAVHLPDVATGDRDARNRPRARPLFRCNRDRRILGPRADARKAGVATSATWREQTGAGWGRLTAPWRLRDTTS